jgi:hypothetical protein
MRLTLSSILWLILTLLITGCDQERQRPVFQYDYNNPAEVGSRYPNLYQDSDGLIYMSWLAGIEEDIYALQYTTLKDGRWTMPGTVRVATDWFVNWADFPSLVGMNGEMVASHWLNKIEGGRYAYNVNIAFAGDGAGRWSEPITPHLDGTATEHGFVSLEPIADDKVLAIWLDGRNTEGRDHNEYEDMDMAMTLRSAEISASGEITRKRVIDDAVCDCCQTDLVQVDDGFIAVYRNRTENEIRDIYISKYTLETGVWSEPRAVWNDGWEIRACPVNGPRIIADGDYVAVAWYTSAGDDSKVLLSRSADGGATFEEPITVTNENTIGRADLLFGTEGSVYVSWMNRVNEFGNIMIRRVTPDGSIGEPLTAGVTSSSRASGFPRIKLDGDEIFVAWTQTEPQLRIRTARIPISDFN